MTPRLILDAQKGQPLDKACTQCLELNRQDPRVSGLLFNSVLVPVCEGDTVDLMVWRYGMLLGGTK